MDNIRWSTTQKRYADKLQLLILVWVFLLFLVGLSFLLKSWIFCGYFTLLFIIITYEQIEAQYKLDNLKRPELFLVPKKAPGESLDSYFSRAIAELDGIDPKEVTPKYITEQLRKRFYPDTRYVSHREADLTSLTKREFEKFGEIADEFLEQAAHT